MYLTIHTYWYYVGTYILIYVTMHIYPYIPICIIHTVQVLYGYNYYTYVILVGLVH